VCPATDICWVNQLASCSVSKLGKQDFIHDFAAHASAMLVIQSKDAWLPCQVCQTKPGISVATNVGDWEKEIQINKGKMSCLEMR
jgi:hypothetical protein